MAALLDLVIDFVPIAVPFQPVNQSRETRLEPANTLVGLAQLYSNLCLELKDNTANLNVLVSKMLQRFHKQPILLAEFSTALPLPWRKSLADGRLPNPSLHRRFATASNITMPTQKRLSGTRKPKTPSKKSPTYENAIDKRPTA